MTDDGTRELLDRIESLEQQVAALLGRREDLLSAPFRPVFLARSPSSDDGEGAAANGFVEQTVNNGQVEDFPDGRRSLVEGDPGNLVEPGDAFAVIEVEDYDANGNCVTRYVPVRSSSVVQVRITGNQSGGGKYNGKIYTGSVEPEDDATWLAAGLAMPETGLSLPQDEDCVVVNLLESNESSHTITAAGAAQKLDLWGLRVGQLSDGRAIIAVQVQPVYSCVTS